MRPQRRRIRACICRPGPATRTSTCSGPVATFPFAPERRFTPAEAPQPSARRAARGTRRRALRGGAIERAWLRQCGDRGRAARAPAAPAQASRCCRSTSPTPSSTGSTLPDFAASGSTSRDTWASRRPSTKCFASPAASPTSAGICRFTSRARGSTTLAPALTRSPVPGGHRPHGPRRRVAGPRPRRLPRAA